MDDGAPSEARTDRPGGAGASSIAAAPSMDADFVAFVGFDAICCVLRHASSIADVLRFAAVSSECAAAVRSHLAALETLDFERCACDDDELTRMLLRSPALRELQLGGLTELGSAGWTELVILMPTTLKRLGLSDTTLDALDLLAVWSALLELTALDLSDCSGLEGQEVERSITALPSTGALAELSIARCPAMTAAAVVHLSGLCGSTLTDLDAAGYDELCTPHAASLGARCTGLRRLCLNECEALTDEAVAHLVPSAQLSRIELSWCPELTADSARALATHCTDRLESLELRCCAGVEAAAAIATLGAHCPSLTLLCLNRCDGTLPEHPPPVGSRGDGGVDGGGAIGSAWAIAPLCACALLSWLDLGWLTELVDDAALAMMLGELPQLTVLSVEGCKLLSDAALAPLHGVSAIHDALTSDRLNGDLQLLDYYGNCWGLVGGKPARTRLLDTASLPRRKLRAWLAAYDYESGAADVT